MLYYFTDTSGFVSALPRVGRLLPARAGSTCEHIVGRFGRGEDIDIYSLCMYAAIYIYS